MIKPTCLALGASLLANPTLHAQSPVQTYNRPNIVLFMVDDMGWQDTSLPFWRHPDGTPRETFLNKRYKTPNMEKLASRGVMFTNAYAQAICSPTRVSLMTGMNSARHRVTTWTLETDKSTDNHHPFLNPPKNWNINGLQPAGTPASGQTTETITEKAISYSMQKPYLEAHTLPQLLKESGYTTIHCGKAHFGSAKTPGANPKNLGFDYNIAGTECGGLADYRGKMKYGGNSRWAVQGLDENNYYEEDVFVTEALTREALKRVDLVRKNPKTANNPFYLYMAHYAIHVPIDQRAYDKRFSPNYKNPKDGRGWTPNEANYAALIEGMDKSLGDIMNYLDENNLTQNTVILFMSDNGGLAQHARIGDIDSNYPLNSGKGSGMEGGIREPMLASWPGVTKPGTISTQQVIIEDFFPTILQIARAPKFKTDQTIDGRSFIPALQGKTVRNNRPLLFHCPNNWINCANAPLQYHPYTALVLGDWKLFYRHGKLSFELYNLADDIGEKHNLAEKDPQRVMKMAKLMTRLLKERKAQMPTFKANNPHSLPAGTPVPMPSEQLVSVNK